MIVYCKHNSFMITHPSLTYSKNGSLGTQVICCTKH